MAKRLYGVLFWAISLALISCASGQEEEEMTEKELRILKRKKGHHIIEMVDNDPEFLVAVRGIEKPLCFHMEGQADDAIRLMQDTESGIIVNARIFFDRHTNKTYLGAIMIAKGNFRLVAKQRIVLVNDQRVEWDDITALRVQGNRVIVGDDMAAVTFRHKRITLVVRRHFASRDNNNIDFPDDEDAPTDVTDGGDDENTATDGNDDDNNQAEGEDAEEVDGEEEEEENTADDNNNNGNDANLDTQQRSPLHEVSSKRRRSLNVQSFFDLHRDQTMAKDVLVQVNDAGEAANSRKKRTTETETVDAHLQADQSPRADRGHGRGQGRQRRRRLGRRHGRRRSRDHGEAGGEDEEVEVVDLERRRNRTIFLGLYIADSRDFSDLTHGLLGQFLFKNVTLDKIRYKNGRMKGRLVINGDMNRRTLALLTLRRNLALNATRACWRVRHQGRDVIDGSYSDYLVPNLRHMNPRALPPPSPL